MKSERKQTNKNLNNQSAELKQFKYTFKMEQITRMGDLK